MTVTYLPVSVMVFFHWYLKKNKLHVIRLYSCMSLGNYSWIKSFSMYQRTRFFETRVTVTQLHYVTSFMKGPKTNVGYASVSVRQVL